MKSFGETRRMDDLGRVVIPKLIREKLNIRDGEAFDVLFDEKENAIMFKKLSVPSLTNQIEELVNNNKSKLPPVAQDLLNIVVKILNDNEDNNNEEN